MRSSQAYRLGCALTSLSARSSDRILVFEAFNSASWDFCTSKAIFSWCDNRKFYSCSSFICACWFVSCKDKSLRFSRSSASNSKGGSFCEFSSYAVLASNRLILSSRSDSMLLCGGLIMILLVLDGRSPTALMLALAKPASATFEWRLLFVVAAVALV